MGISAASEGMVSNDPYAFVILEDYLIARAGAATGCVALLLTFVSMGLTWVDVKLEVDVPDGSPRFLKDGSSGLWSGDLDGLVVPARVTCVVSCVFNLLILGNRVVAGFASSPLDASVWVVPPCPTCMFFGGLQALLPWVTVGLFAAEAHRSSAEAPEWRAGLAVACVAGAFAVLFFVLLCVSHVATRRPLWWYKGGSVWARLCCVYGKGPHCPWDNEAPSRRREPDAAAAGRGGKEAAAEDAGSPV